MKYTKQGNFPDSTGKISLFYGQVIAVGPANVRVLPNSPSYVQSLNYGQPFQANEAAITADLKPDWSYSVVMSDLGGSGRIGHLRVVTSDTVSDSRIRGFSLRGDVEQGDYVLIAGFHLDRTMSIAVRGSGPSLAQFGLTGLLADPRIGLYSGSTLLYSCNDINAATKSSLQSHYGGWPIDDKEAGFANLLLPAGDYTVILMNQNPSTSAYGIGHLDIQEW